MEYEAESELSFSERPVSVISHTPSHIPQNNHNIQTLFHAAIIELTATNQHKVLGDRLLLVSELIDVIV